MAWSAGDMTAIAALFDPTARLVAPGLAAEIDGRDAIVASYAGFAAAATTEAFDITDHSLSLYGDVAVATYVFVIVMSWRAATRRTRTGDPRPPPIRSRVEGDLAHADLARLKHTRGPTGNHRRGEALRWMRWEVSSLRTARPVRCRLVGRRCAWPGLFLGRLTINTYTY